MKISAFHKMFFSMPDWPHWRPNKPPLSVKAWHNGYTQMYNEAQNLSKSIKLLNAKSDYNFLERLIHEKENFVANAGSSLLSEAVFHHLISEKGFLTALSTFMKNSNAKNFVDFAEAWYQYGSGNGQYTIQEYSKPLRINRVAGACMKTVTSIAHIEKFNETLKVLKKRKQPNGQNEFTIPHPQKIHGRPYINRHAVWLQQNESLMAELTRILKQEGVTTNIDHISISMFAWALFLEVRGRFGPSCRL